MERTRREDFTNSILTKNSGDGTYFNAYLVVQSGEHFFLRHAHRLALVPALAAFPASIFATPTFAACSCG